MTENEQAGAETAARVEGEQQAAAGSTPEQAKQAAATAAQEQRPELTDAEADRIAGKVIEHLEARGVFEEPEPPAEKPAETPPPPAESAPADTAPANTDEPPAKRSLAARFMGHK